MKQPEWKVFEFAKNGYSYTVKAETKEQARKFLSDDHGIEIKNCIEIPESEWDKPTIAVYEDNDREKEPYHISIRDAFNEDEAEILCTNDLSLID